MGRALRVEWMKLRRSSVAYATSGLIVVLVPLLCLAFVAAAKGDVGVGAAALKARAMVVGEGWDAYLGLAGQMVAVTMFIGPGVVVTWTFGREHADRTFASLFALPVSRSSVATAKFMALFCFCAMLTALLVPALVVAGLLGHVGALSGLPLPQLGRLTLSALLSATMSLTVGLLASVGRGYLPAIGGLLLLTMAAQLSVVFGVGAWFPYAAPGLYAVAAAEEAPDVNATQLLLVPLTTLVFAFLTVRWWARVEVV